MIIPIGLEEDTVRRHPWVTYAIMILCVAVFIPTQISAHRALRTGVEGLSKALRFHAEHPYLELDPRLRPFAGGAAAPEGRGAKSPDPEFRALEQVELDTLTRAGLDAVGRTPHRRWGFVPARLSPVGLVSYMFLHGGVLHLVANLLFLYLSAPFIEDVWGRRFFAGFYLASGVAAALLFALRYPGLDTPLVGASGAIAGVMGAFLVRHWQRRIRFFYWFVLLFRGTFSAPAWIILPLWFLRELLSAHAMDVVAPAAGGGGVAYWAHVGGFGFGVAAAAVIRWRNWEQRYLSRSVERGTVLVDNTVLDRAMENRRQGRTDEAWLLLLKEARRAPENWDAAAALWDLAAETGRVGEAAPFVLRLLRRDLQRGEPVEAFLRWKELRARGGGRSVPLSLEAKLAEDLSRAGCSAEAQAVLVAAAERAGADAPPGTLVKLAKLAQGQERVKLAAAALSHPELPAQLRVELEIEGLVAQPPSPALAAAPAASAAARPDGRALQAVLAVPVQLQAGVLVLAVGDRGRRNLNLERVKGVAGAAVGPGEELLCDLLLERPSRAASRVQTVRIEGRTFDATALVPSEEEPEDAFLSLLGRVAAESGAPWLLGQPTHRLPRYASVREYERELMSALALAGH